jgi:hypothetical protein
MDIQLSERPNGRLGSQAQPPISLGRTYLGKLACYRAGLSKQRHDRRSPVHADRLGHGVLFDLRVPFVCSVRARSRRRSRRGGIGHARCQFITSWVGSRALLVRGGFARADPEAPRGQFAIGEKIKELGHRPPIQFCEASELGPGLRPHIGSVVVPRDHGVIMDQVCIKCK